MKSIDGFDGGRVGGSVIGWEQRLARGLVKGFAELLLGRSVGILTFSS